MKKLFRWVWLKILDLWVSFFMLVFSTILWVIVGILRRLAVMKGFDPNLSIEEMLEKQYTVLLHQAETVEDISEEVINLMKALNIQAKTHVEQNIVEPIFDGHTIEAVETSEKNKVRKNIVKITPKRKPPTSGNRLKSKTKKLRQSKRK